MSGNVLHVHWTFPPTTGGVESYLIDLARLQALEGRRIVVLTGEACPEHNAAYEVISTPMLQLEAAREARLAGRMPIAALEALLSELIESRDVQIVHAHNMHHFSPAPAMALERLRRSLDIHVHHTFHETWPDVITDLTFYRNWRGNYAISTFVRDECERLIGCRPDVLRLGVDTDRFKVTRPPFGDVPEFRILHPARLLPWKGVHVSVEALRILREDGWNARLILTDTQRIADWDHALPPYREELLASIDRLGLAPHVEFVNAAFSDMPALYNSVDVVLYPTVKDEPLGLVPMEAMACGRPVVASRSGGIVESLLHEQTGYLVAPGDAGELAQGIARLLADPDGSAAMGAAGRRHVEECLSAKAHAAELARRYALAA